MVLVKPDITVQSLDELTATDVSSMPEGTLAYVVDANHLFVLSKQTRGEPEPRGRPIWIFKRWDEGTA